MSVANNPAMSFILGQPFAEQVAFFRGKLDKLVPTQVWHDLWKEQHDRAFMVAGAAKTDLLKDLANAVDKAIADGETLDEFRARFDNIVKKHGWTGWTGDGSEAGKNWRTRIIYNTNLSTSYAAGRYKQLTEAGFKFWVYRHNDSVVHPRPHHVALDGLTLPPSHPFWQTHYPPNGWGCRCRVVGTNSEKGAARVGGKPGYTEPPAGWDARTPDGRLPGIDEGWDYAPGASVVDHLRPFTPQFVEQLPPHTIIITQGDIAGSVNPPFPKPRYFPPELLLPDGKDEDFYLSAFFAAFDLPLGGSKIITDPTGERMVINLLLFENHKRKKSKLFKDGKRHIFIRMLAETILRPQEIWETAVRMDDTGELSIRRRFIVRWDVGGEEHFGLSVFEFLRGNNGVWTGVTAFSPRDSREKSTWAYIQDQRQSVLKWQENTK